MHKNTHIYTVLAILILMMFFSSCNREYQKALKSDDINLKLEYAEKYYNQKDYDKAIPLLRDLIGVYRGTTKGETIYYYYAFSLYSTKQYVLAAYFFEQLMRHYPHGQYSEDAAFLYANSLYFVSPGPTLDQTNTKNAIRGFQNFANRYPNSDKLDEAHQKMDELLETIEIKSFNNAILYYQIHEYRAAVWALRSFIQTYPASTKKEAAYYYIVKAQFSYANLSIEDKKAERFRNVVLAYNDFIEFFPESEYLSELEEFRNSANEYLKTSYK